MTRLHQLHDRHGQSPWPDNLTGHDLVSGRLGRRVGDGIRGVTSNLIGPDTITTLPETAIAAAEGVAAFADGYQGLLSLLRARAVEVRAS